MTNPMRKILCALVLMTAFPAAYGTGRNGQDPLPVRRGLERGFPRLAHEEPRTLTPTDNGDSRNVRLVGRWAYGPCYAAATAGNYVFFGNGCYVEIADISNPSNAVRRGKLECRCHHRLGRA